MNTTGLAAKKALKNLFASVVEAPTEVHFNRPNTKHQPEENVYVCDVIKGHREPKTLVAGYALRTHQVEEVYLVQVDIEVLRRGTDSEGTEERAWAIASQLETALAADVTLGNLDNVQTVFVAECDQASEGGTDGWACTITLGIAVTARI